MARARKEGEFKYLIIHMGNEDEVKEIYLRLRNANKELGSYEGFVEEIKDLPLLVYNKNSFRISTSITFESLGDIEEFRKWYPLGDVDVKDTKPDTEFIGRMISVENALSSLNGMSYVNGLCELLVFDNRIDKGYFLISDEVSDSDEIKWGLLGFKAGHAMEPSVGYQEVFKIDDFFGSGRMRDFNTIGIFDANIRKGNFFKYKNKWWNVKHICQINTFCIHYGEPNKHIKMFLPYEEKKLLQIFG